MGGERWGFQGWGPEGWGPEGWGPEGWGAQNFALFFPVPPQNSFFSFLCGAAGVSHDSPRAQTCTFEGPGLQKHHQNSTRRHPEREEKNEFCGGRGKKKSKILGGPGEGGPGKGGPGKGGPGKGGPGKGGPGKGGPGKGGPGKGGPGKGGEHDQTKTLKPPHGNRETKTHKHTHKHTQTHTHTNTHTQTHTQTHTHTNTHKNKSKSVWPKSAMTVLAAPSPSPPQPSAPENTLTPKHPPLDLQAAETQRWA